MLDLNVKIHVAAPTLTLNCYTIRWCLILRFHHEIFPASLLILAGPPFTLLLETAELVGGQNWVRA